MKACKRKAWKHIVFKVLPKIGNKYFVPGHLCRVMISSMKMLAVQSSHCFCDLQQGTWLSQSSSTSGICTNKLVKQLDQNDILSLEGEEVGTTT